MKRLQLVSVAALLLAGCATTTPLYQEGMALIEAGDCEAGTTKLEQAAKASPGDPHLRSEYHRMRDGCIQKLLAQAAQKEQAGETEQAEKLYRRVLRIDPRNQRALVGVESIAAMRRHLAQIQEARRLINEKAYYAADNLLNKVLTENPDNREARALRREIQEALLKSTVGEPVLKSRLDKPVNLEFRDANLKLVFEALSRASGINFTFDRDVKTDVKTTIFVRQVRVEDAVELILAPQQLAKKVLSDNAVLIYPNTPQKVKEYQELVIRSFYLGNADAKQTLNMIKTLLKTRDVFIDEKVNMLIMRDTPEAVQLAQKLIVSQDLAEPEVMLELEVLEVTRSKLTELGLVYPSKFTGPGGTIKEAFTLNSSNIGVNTGLVLNLKAEDGRTNILASPRIRVRNKEKAKVHVGDRVPVVTATVTPSTGTPVVTETIQYLDVGLKLDVEPTVHLNDEVGMKITLDVSTFTRLPATANGSTPIQVSTRNAATTLRIGDGDTQVLMGLIQSQEQNTRTKVPVVGDVPLLGRLFSNDLDDDRKTEIVLLITPHVVRNVERPEAHIAEFWSGTETSLKTQPMIFQSVGEASPAGLTPVAAAAAAAGGDAATLGAALPPGPSPGRLALEWSSEGPMKQGSEFTVTLKGQTDVALRSLALLMRFDPRALEVVNVSDGEFFRQGGKPVVLTHQVSPNGTLTASLSREGDAGAKGEGPLLKITFKALAGAPTNLHLVSVTPVDEAQRRVRFQASGPLELKPTP